MRQVQDVRILDNINNTVRDDLRAEIKRGSRVSVAAACFSMYAYQELKKQLESVETFRYFLHFWIRRSTCTIRPPAGSLWAWDRPC